MKTATIASAVITEAGRMDSPYFLSPAHRTSALIGRLADDQSPTAFLGGPAGLAHVWAPKRFKRSYAVPGETSVPYLRPYDVLRYLPGPADWLSAPRTRDIDSYLLRVGTILQTCSGRNLGPAVIVDRYLCQFALSHDMVRIEVADERLRLYVLAFLNSPVGRQLLRRDKTGSVIDHISVQHLAGIRVPLPHRQLLDTVAREMSLAIALREGARLKLHSLVAEYEAQLPSVERDCPARTGWTVMSETLTDRIDAAYHDERVLRIRRDLAALGGVRVGDVARVLKPAGRYKTRYVSDSHGKPILSGSQILQVRPVNLQYMPSHQLRDAGRYEVRAGWIVYQADGRAEEDLGTPAIVTPDRDGWLASGHVGRLVAKPGVDSGWLYLALRTAHAQHQIKACASGSVVDSTFPPDMEDVILPPLLGIDSGAACRSWHDFCTSSAKEEQAIHRVDAFVEELLAK